MPTKKTKVECDPQQLRRVETLNEIAALARDSEGVLVCELTDAKLAAIAARVPRLRYLIADGNTRVTDAGLEALGKLERLECLDLEWSAVTDAGISSIAAVRTLRWVDLGFCNGVSSQCLAELQRLPEDVAAGLWHARIEHTSRCRRGAAPFTGRAARLEGGPVPLSRGVGSSASVGRLRMVISGRWPVPTLVTGEHPNGADAPCVVPSCR